jgi:hypothetical protein
VSVARLREIDRITTPGKALRPNEDALGFEPRLAIVLDGATGLGSKLLDAPSDAAWLASEGAERFVRHAGSLTGPALIAQVAEEVEAEFIRLRHRAPLETYELPMASLILVQLDEADRLRVQEFGDCGLIISRPDGSVEAVGKGFHSKDEEGKNAARLAAQQGVRATDNLTEPTFQAALRAGRNRYNGGGGAWVFAPQAACAAHATSHTLHAPRGSRLLLATDGFLALVTDYERYDAQGLIAAVAAQGLGALMAELRAIEADDPDGVRYPRFKQSDDATALFVEVI